MSIHKDAEQEVYADIRYHIVHKKAHEAVRDKAAHAVS